MKKNELRIGNLLRDKVSKTELKVIELTEKDIVTYVIDRSKFPLKNGWGIEPMPLTEDLLLRFDFKKIENDGVYYTLNGVNIDLDFETFLINNHSDMWDNYGVKLNYVHELQNLYFALTKEELKINE